MARLNSEGNVEDAEGSIFPRAALNQANTGISECVGDVGEGVDTRGSRVGVVADVVLNGN